MVMGMYEAQLKAWFEDHREEYRNDLAGLVAIPSAKGEALPGKPFGEGPAAALEHALELAKKYGFASARNHGGYVGLIDLVDGSQERELEILAHLDVVPAGEGWTVTEPFVMKLLDGKLYGRGTADDKGPALAALYAMRAVKELGIPVSKNVRLVLGTDEECGSGDIVHYYDQVPEAPMTFSPDGDFPVINIEKGAFNGDGRWEATTPETQLLSIQAGVKRNVIPGKARAALAHVDVEAVKAAACAVSERTGVKFSVSGEETLEILAEGSQGHASMPVRYNNALTALLELLCALPLEGSPAQEMLKKLQSYFPHGDWRGKAAGVAVSDEESGELSISLNILNFQNGALTFAWDSRVPVSGKNEELDRLPAALEADGFTMEVSHRLPHCVPTDSDFVQTLLRCYESCTGLPGYSMAIGGGTYVHEMKNGVAFGCTFPGTDNNMHGADEMAVEDELISSGVIFAEAIARLCK